MTTIYETIANKNGVTAEEVKREIEVVVNQVYENRERISNKKIKKFLKKGKPTADDFIIFASKLVSKEAYIYN